MTLSDIASFWDRHPACTLHPGRTALVLDSPHSGTLYPADFRFACPAQALRMAEDTDVDTLWGFAPSMGAALLLAHFPRSYIDVNRALDELDASMLTGTWPLPLARSTKVRLGKGLIWRQLDDGTPIYDRGLSVAEAQMRIDRCWQPYHRLLDEAIAEARSRHPMVIHIDCHSMPSVAQAYSTEHPYEAHPDFVLGDRDGTTAAPQLTRWIERFLNSRGYTVGVNHPYKGVEIVRRHGRPSEGCHSIQLEINKRLYMNETTLERRAEFDRVQAALRELLEQLTATKHNF
ncbi:N-formylglutamate amidohydrolase [Schlegelella sp. S2-27]|uniref:N-formylglutamate amidohydrolase n=1 Tax=Caldimonas mangrovi TaxID=2944811 RepID=A0ABT0YSX1_9BURK|nr:N-formylglutamate amidohydrolase [Caldimonas mangrovi]MCM5681849.1 N-formylglutamate amidohydrolase [Caldimonas mangrovi]